MQDSVVQQIKDRLDIIEVIGSYIKLQKAGANYKAVCPFHSEKTPSFFVSPGRQIWHCFGACGTGGDIFKFVMQIEGMEFGEALRVLAQKAGVQMKPVSPQLKTEQQRFAEICEWACSFFEKQLAGNVRGREAMDYLLGRSISRESVKKWRIGYAPDHWQALSDFLVGRGYSREEAEKAGLAIKKQQSPPSTIHHPSSSFYDRFRGRIMFPVFDLNSRVIGFGGRLFEKEPAPDAAKYVNTPNTLLYDKSRVLYGLDKAKMAIRKQNYCILVEGYTDAILVSQSGFENVVATSGTALTPYQLKILKRYSDNIYTAFDMDPAGWSATKRGIELAQSQGFNIRVISMPPDLDPADMAAQSPEQWQTAVKTAKSIIQFYFETVFSKFATKGPIEKKELSQILLPVIKRIPNKIERAHWIQELAGGLEVQEEDVREELAKVKQDLAPEAEAAPFFNPLKRKSRQILLEERLLGLILSCSDNLGLLKDSDIPLFSEENSRLITHFREKGVVRSGELPPDFPQELGERLNQLWLRSEVFPTEVNPEIEAKECLKELRKLAIKKRRAELCSAVRKAERDDDRERVNQLLQEFEQLNREIDL